MSRPRSDRGAAALELALVLLVMLGLLSLVIPLAHLLYVNVSLGRAGGEAIRFASSRVDVDRPVGPSGTDPVLAGYLPSTDQVAAELLRFDRLGPITLSGPVASSTDLRCPSGRRRTLVLTTTVDLGPVGAAFAGLTGAAATQSLTTTATSCEE